MPCPDGWKAGGQDQHEAKRHRRCGVKGHKMELEHWVQNTLQRPRGHSTQGFILKAVEQQRRVRQDSPQLRKQSVKGGARLGRPGFYGS